MGSGQKLVKKMKAHPDHEWHKEVLMLLDTEEEAYQYEALSIGDRWKGGKDYDGLCLNLTAGGMGMCSEAMASLWADDDYKAKQSAAISNGWINSSRQAKATELKERWSDADYSKAMSDMTKACWESEEYRKKRRDSLAVTWSDEKRLQQRDKSKRSIKLLVDGQIVELPNHDHEGLIQHLISGAVFKAVNVGLHNDTTKTWVATSAKRAKAILLAHPEWRYGKCRSYTKMGVKALNLSSYSKEQTDA